MFKKIEDVSNINPLNKTAQKKLREKIIDTMPLLEGVLEDFMPKKCNINSQKFYTQDSKYELFWVEKFPAFFKNDKEDELFPTMRLVHMYPDCLPRMQTDAGAIKFILNGSNVMSKGLQTPGAFIDPTVQNGTIVAVYAEGKENAMGIGKCTMNAQGIKEAEIGEGIIMHHIIGDQLWLLQEPKKK